MGAATVNVTADDHAADNNIGDDPHVVTINNVAPIVSPPAVDAPENQNATEGSAHAFAIGSFVDAGSSDGPWAVEIDWGDGTPNDTFNQATQGSLGTASHGFGDDGVYVVTIYVTDKDTATGHASFSVTVNNVAPTIAISGAASVNEGSPYSLTLGAVTDPGTDTVSELHRPLGRRQLRHLHAPTAPRRHTYADGPSNPAITVDLVDEDGTFLDAANAFSVTVNNVAPTIAISVPPASTRARPTA